MQDKHISRLDIHDNSINQHLDQIHREFEDGFEFLKKYPRTVTIFGSSRTILNAEYYKKAEELAYRIANELKYAVLTGGGPGIMEASNKGAYDAKSPSLGFNISLPREWKTNAYVTHSLKFNYFFSRKTMLDFAAEAYVFFPGGYGTFDELFTILTLIQTEKIPRVPIIMFGSEFWKGFFDFVNTYLNEKFSTIDAKDVKLFEITDSIDRVIEVIHKAPVSDWWRNIS